MRLIQSRSYVRALLCLSVLCAACGPDGSSNPTLNEVQLREVWRLGAEGDGSGAEFADNALVSRSQSGVVYVYDQMANRLDQIGADGVPLRRIGQTGQGPGEFETVVDILAGPRGGVLVLTLDGRLLEFDDDGAELAGRRVGVRLSTDSPLSFGPTGELRAAYLETPSGLDGSPARIGLLRLDDQGLDTIAEPADSPWDSEVTLGQELVSFKKYVAWLPSAVAAVAVGSRSEIGMRSPTGRFDVVQTPYVPVVFSAAERSDWERQNQFLRNRSGSPGRFPLVPDVKPTVRGLLVTPTGDVWVIRRTETSGKDPSSVGSIAGLPVTPRWFEPFLAEVVVDMEFKTRVVGPADLRVLEVWGDTIWGVRQGQLGEDVLVRMEAR